MNNKTDSQSRRDTLTADIIEQVRNAIHEELLFAPQSLTDDGREAIEDDILTQSRIVVDALSTEEMTSEGALLSYIASARWVQPNYLHCVALSRGAPEAQLDHSSALWYRLPHTLATHP